MKIIADIHIELKESFVEEELVTPENIEKFKREIEKELGLQDEAVEKYSIDVKVEK